MHQDLDKFPTIFSETLKGPTAGQGNSIDIGLSSFTRLDAQMTATSTCHSTLSSDKKHL